MLQDDDPKLVFIPEDELSKVRPGHHNNILNAWWCCHPEKGLVFYRRYPSAPPSPQCNRSESITRMLAKNLYGDWVKVRQIEFVSLSFNIADYV